jgi:EmrB/QacA subfamily drug resistance transporter
LASESIETTDSAKLDKPEGFRALTKKQLVGTVIGLQLTLLLAAIDQTIVSTAMPRIIASLNGFDRYAWVTTAYLLTSTAAVPIFGRLSDIFGRKWILLAGTAAFVLTSLLCGAAGQFPGIPFDGMTQLIIARGLQGIAGGIIFAIVFTVIGDIFPPAERGKYMGLFSGVWGLASMVGPALGGWLTDHFSWRSIFYVNLPLGMLALTVLYIAFPYVRPSGVQRKIDYAGAVTLIAFLVPLLLGTSAANVGGWLSPSVLANLFVALVMGIWFYSIETKATEPIMPPALLKVPDVGVSLAVLCFASVAMFDVVLFAPLFMQTVMGISASRAGYLYTALPLTMSVSSALSGQLISRTRHYKLLAMVGTSIAALSLFLLSRTDASCSETNMVLMLVMFGIGLGTTMPVFSVLVQNAAPPNMIGAATAMSQFWRSIGATLGAAILGSIMQARYLEQLHLSEKTSLPADLLKQLENPARLTQTKQQIISAYSTSAEGARYINEIFQNVSGALVYSLDRVFLLGSIFCVFAFIITLFVREKELRGK